MVTEIIDSVTIAMDEEVFGQMLAERLKAEVCATRDATAVTSSFKRNLISYGSTRNIDSVGHRPSVYCQG